MPDDTRINDIQLLFPLGTCYLTPGINELIEQHQLPLPEFLYRHQTGDWSEMSAEDRAENQLSIKEGYRILSAFCFKPNANVSIKIWVITEADRSSTTVLLPSEY